MQIQRHIYVGTPSGVQKSFGFVKIRLNRVCRRLKKVASLLNYEFAMNQMAIRQSLLTPLR